MPETQRTSREHTRVRLRPYLNCFADSTSHVRHRPGRRSAPPAAGPGDKSGSIRVHYRAALGLLTSKMIGQGEGAYSSWHETGLEWPEGDENWSAPWLQPTPLQASLHISRKVRYPRRWIIRHMFCARTFVLTRPGSGSWKALIYLIIVNLTQLSGWGAQCRHRR